MRTLCGPGRCTTRCVTVPGACEVPGRDESGPREVVSRSTDAPGRLIAIRSSCCAKHSVTGGSCPAGGRHLEEVRPLQTIVDELADATRVLDTIRGHREEAVRLLFDEDGALSLARLRVQLLSEELDAHVKRLAASR
jgi:hypothetical protein